MVYSSKILVLVILSNKKAPSKAKIKAGIPNCTAIFQLICFLTKTNLNALFKKCTIAVKAIATSIGKNNAKAGNNNVPNPKPEKKVRAEASNATIGIIMYSI
jgi:hypothetical protein